MMQEIRNQHEIVAGPEIDVERAAGFCLVAIADARGLGILFCYFQYVRPINGGNLDLRILFGERDAVQAVTGRDIQHPQFFLLLDIHQLRHQLGWHGHHRGHRARELHPHRVFRFESRIVSTAALAHGFGQVVKVVFDMW